MLQWISAISLMYMIFLRLGKKVSNAWYKEHPGLQDRIFNVVNHPTKAKVIKIRTVDFPQTIVNYYILVYVLLLFFNIKPFTFYASDYYYTINTANVY